MEQYELTDIEFEDATRVGNKIYEESPLALRARYDRREKKIVVALNNGVEIRFSYRIAQGLSEASDDDLSEIVIEGDGLGINFPKIDADLYVPALSRFILGSEQWMKQLPDKLMALEQENNNYGDKHKDHHGNYAWEGLNIMTINPMLLPSTHQDTRTIFKDIFNKIEEPLAFLDVTMVTGKSDRATVRVTGANITQSPDEYQQTKLMRSKPGQQSYARLYHAGATKIKKQSSASLISEQIIH